MGISVARLERLTVPDANERPALVSPKHVDWLTLDELASAAIISQLIARTSLGEVRRGAERLSEWGYRSFANRGVLRQLAVSGSCLMFTEGDDPVRLATGQIAAAPLIAPYLERFDFGTDGSAKRWRSNDDTVVLDPEIQCGSPCIAGTRVGTDVIAAMASSGLDEDQIAADLWLTEAQINAAIAFEAAPAGHLLPT